MRITPQVRLKNAISIVVEYPIHLALKFRFRLPPERAIKKYAARRRDASPNRPGTIGTQQRSGLCGAHASGSLAIDFHRGPMGRTYGRLPYLTLGSVVAPADVHGAGRHGLKRDAVGYVATPFPGIAALAPCLGAALIIAADQSGTSFVGRALAVRPLVFVESAIYSVPRNA